MTDESYCLGSSCDALHCSYCSACANDIAIYDDNGGYICADCDNES